MTFYYYYLFKLEQKENKTYKDESERKKEKGQIICMKNARRWIKKMI